MTPNSKARVLLVDDEPALTRAFAVALEQDSAALACAATVSEALAALRAAPFDVVLADLYLSPDTGLDLMARMQAEGHDAGVVLITGRPQLDDLARALRLGAYDFLIKPASVQTLRQAVSHAFHKVRLRRAQAAETAQQATALAAAAERAQFLQTSLHSLEEAVVEALLASLAVREQDCIPHSFRVRAYAMHMAAALQYPAPLRKHLAHAALLHDIGKVGLSDSLLFRPGPFTAPELERMKPHAALGEQILSRVDFLRPAALIVRHHHERFDGSGYPDGLSGENIPLGARIFTLVDALDALTNDQVYRPAQSFEEAQEEVARWSGRQFDPRIIEAFRRVPAANWRQLRLRVEQQFQQREPMQLLGSRLGAVQREREAAVPVCV